MSYIVSAWLERGGPRLGILCADTGVIQQQWYLDKININNNELYRRELSCFKRPGIQQLTRELFKVGCAQEISLLPGVQSVELGSVCLYCNQCIQGSSQHLHGDMFLDGGK
ncbi:MAG: hypothetical protein GXP19_07425 [Gammaproteobacteria bacterium]|nr:hypothetical protein [Gammaproteobacteria bacterium]